MQFPKIKLLILTHLKQTLRLVTDLIDFLPTLPYHFRITGTL